MWEAFPAGSPAAIIAAYAVALGVAEAFSSAAGLALSAVPTGSAASVVSALKPKTIGNAGLAGLAGLFRVSGLRGLAGLFAVFSRRFAVSGAGAVRFTGGQGGG